MSVSPSPTQFLPGGHRPQYQPSPEARGSCPGSAVQRCAGSPPQRGDRARPARAHTPLLERPPRIQKHGIPCPDGNLELVQAPFLGSSSHRRTKLPVCAALGLRVAKGQLWRSVWSSDMKPGMSTHVGTRPFTMWSRFVGEKRRGPASVLGLGASSSYATKLWYEIQ